MSGESNAGVEKRARSHDEEGSTTKKRKRYDEKPQRANRRTERRQLMSEAKATWEQLRPKATTKQKSAKLVTDLHKILDGRLIEFVFRHDGSRIVQWMLSEGTETQKRAVMDELMKATEPSIDDLPFFVKLACDRYGHHLAFKMLRVSDKSNKAVIFERYLRGHTAYLIKNSHGADVLDFAYQTILNARQRSELVIELLYSREQKLLESIRSKLFDEEMSRRAGVARNIFSDSLKLVDDTFRDVVVESACATLTQMMDKERILSYEVFHAAVKEYLIVVTGSYGKEKSIEMAVQLGPVLMEFAHTKPGVFVAINCVKILDAKHRKKVVRGLKSHIRKIVKNEYGHRLIIGLFEWVDDTRLVGKTVATEILSKSKLDTVLNEEGDEGRKTKRGGRNKGGKKGKGNTESVGDETEMDLEYVKELCMDKYGRMVFVNLFWGRDSRYMNPDVYGLIWEDVDEEKFGKTSKKDGNVRRRELRGMFEEAVSRVMESEMRSLLCCHWSSGIVIGAAETAETRKGVMRGIGACLRDEAACEEVVKNKCGRKTLGVVAKVGAEEMAKGILQEGGMSAVERLWTREESRGICESFVRKSGWKEARRVMERKMC